MATSPHLAITGASRGIGRAIAERFLTAGWTVWALNRNSNPDEGLQKLGNVQFIPFDASQETSVLAAASTLRERVPALNVLVNNAGISISAPASKTSTAQFQNLLAINLMAPFLLSRELLPPLTSSGAGRVINIASIAALRGMKYTSAYCASKHALLGLSRSLAVEWAKDNITVNAICPGWTETDMFLDSVRMVAKSTRISEEEAHSRLAAMGPLNRVVSAAEVAELTFFLGASAGAKSITGGAFPIDAGESL